VSQGCRYATDIHFVFFEETEMNITRRGSYRDRGTTSIISNLSLASDSDDYWKNNIHWNPNNKSIYMKAELVRSPSGRSHHNYSIRLTLEDVAGLIDLLGHAGSKSDAKLLRDCLSDKIPAIVKILACATGVQPLVIESAEDEEGGE
jgi:hypothetical protein